MKLWICIPVFNRKDFTLRCLASLEQQTYRNFTLVICDHGSIDGSSEAIRQHYPHAVVIDADNSLWWTGAINVCVRYALAHAAEHDTILTLNNDTELPPDYLQQLALCGTKYPNGIITSVIYDIDTGKLFETGYRQDWLWAKSRPVDFAADHVAGDPGVVEITHASGRGTLFPIAVFKAVGLFDAQRLPHYAADYDFAFKAARAGFKIYLSNNCKVYSHVKATGLYGVLSGFSLSSLRDYFFGIRSPANLSARFWIGWNNCPAALLPVYLAMDFIRITGSYFKHFLAPKHGYDMNRIKPSLLKHSPAYSGRALSGVLCPVCGHTQGLHLYTVSCEEAAQHFVLKQTDAARHQALAEHIAKLWQQDDCDVVRCSCCDFVYANPYVAGDATFYTLAYQRTGYPKWKWEYRQTAAAVAELCAPSQNSLTLLEIGAGDGAFVRAVAPALIPKKNVLCLEFSEYGRRRITEYGIECLAEDVRALDATRFNHRFGVICLFQVLEHMDRLDDLFGQLHALSASPAHLFITVPNPARIEFNETHGGLLDMPPNHIGRWNRNGFERIAGAYGWSVADCRVEPFNALEVLQQQIKYRYLKRSQDPASMANRIERLSRSPLRTALRAACAGLYATGRLKVLADALADKSRGDALWLHLVKEA